MHFEHLIAINDPGNPLVVRLSRAELWAGLHHRIEDARPFLPGLEKSVILERTPAGLYRELDFGTATIRDRVTFAAGDWVRFDIEPGAEHAGGSLTIRIEEPAPEALFLRFTYETPFAEGVESPDRAYVDYLKSAYYQSDLDCVRTIRMLAADDGAPQ